MSVITDILDRLSGVEVVKEKLRETGARIERLAQRVVELDHQVQEVDRRLVRMETLVEVAKGQQGGARRLPKGE
jgi:chromosome segregation ATPase